MRAPASFGALNLLRADVVGTLGLLDLRRRSGRELEGLGDISSHP